MCGSTVVFPTATYLTYTSLFVDHGEFVLPFTWEVIKSGKIVDIAAVTSVVITERKTGNTIGSYNN